jgi:hypothetical protein
MELQYPRWSIDRLRSLMHCFDVVEELEERGSLV